MDAVCCFTFVARPQADHSEAAVTGGAYINAWVAHSDEAIAEQIARDAIVEEKWSIERIDQQSLVSREDYKDSPDQLERFEQALIDGYCLVIHSWPSDAPDSDDETPVA